MKLERDVFLTQLERLNPALPNASKVPAFLHIWFDGTNARACDGGLGISVPVTTDFKLGVPGKPLLGLMSGTSVETVELANGKASLNLKVKIGSSHVELASLPADEGMWQFPDTIPPKTPAIELTEAFIDGLRRVSFVKQPEKPRRVENYGVTLFAVEKQLALIATDSRTMARVDVEGAVPKWFERVVLPRAFVEQIVAQCAPGAKLYLLKDCLIIQGENVSLYSTVLDNSKVDDLPKFMEGFFAKVDSKLTVPPGLAETINRAILLSKQDKEEPMVQLGVMADKLYLDGSYRLGVVDDEFDLGKDSKAGEAAIFVNLGAFRAALGQSEQFSITDIALVLYGSDGFSCLIAGGRQKKEDESAAD